MDTFNAAGRIATDLACEQTPNGTDVVSFRLAVDAGKDRTDFLPVVVYGEYSATVATYGSKGRLVQVAGRVRQHTWTNDDGDNRERFDIVASTVRWLDANPANRHSEPVASGEPF